MMAKPDFTAMLLPVPQFKESHDLKLDPAQIGPAGATVVAAPYQAMSVGDAVTLTLFFSLDDGTPIDEIRRTKALTGPDIGQPIVWTIPQADLQILFPGDQLKASYRIEYSTPTVTTSSEEQILHAVENFDPGLLPRLSIKNFDGESLNPEDYPDGIVLIVSLYPGIEAGDVVLLYAVGKPRVITAIRVDQTTIDSGKLETPLGYEWLAANNGEEVSLMYQYARAGSAGSSMALSLMLRKPVFLPPPVVDGAIREGEDDEYKGYLLGRSTTSGITVDLPADAEIGPNDKVQMVFDGFKPGGYYVADPIVGNTRRFQMPKQYVPANLGKRLYVFYEVTLPGGDVYKSRRFDLRISDLDSGWPTLQITFPPAPGNNVSLKTVTDAVNFRLRSWTFMAEGQRVRITAKGVLQAGGQETFKLRDGAAEVVTEDEYFNGEIMTTLPRTFLTRLKLNEQFDVTVAISFDDGTTYKQLPMLSPRLVE